MLTVISFMLDSSKHSSRLRGPDTHSDLETLLRVLDAASEEAHAENEQQVTQDRPEERRLYDLRKTPCRQALENSPSRNLATHLDFTLGESDDGDDELDSVSECSVQHFIGRLEGQ